MISSEINSQSISTRTLETQKINFVNPFTKHPTEVGMTYIEHTRFALMLSGSTFLMALASLIHAFLPFLFVTYTSRNINRLHEILVTRNSKNSK
jgi:hypothetical protein